VAETATLIDYFVPAGISFLYRRGAITRICDLTM
jgi:hypothetical protein